MCLELILGGSGEFGSHLELDRLAPHGFKADIHLSRNLSMPKEHIGRDPLFALT